MSNGILFLPDIMSEGFEKSFAALRLWRDKSMTEIFITVLQIICWTLEQLLNYHFKQLLSLFTFEAYIFIARKVNSKCLLSHKRTLSLILCTLSVASLCSFFKEKSLRFLKHSLGTRVLPPILVKQCENKPGYCRSLQCQIGWEICRSKAQPQKKEISWIK